MELVPTSKMPHPQAHAFRVGADGATPASHEFGIDANRLEGIQGCVLAVLPATASNAEADDASVPDDGV
jgi:hypothetical protein